MAKSKYMTSELIDYSLMDLRGLSSKELRAATFQLIHTAEQRYAAGVKKFGNMGALKTYGERTFARAKLDTKGNIIGTMSAGKQSLRGKSDEDVIKEFQIAQQFLASKTSTAAGRAEVIKKTEATLGVKLKPAEYVNLWETFNKVEEMAKAGLIPSFYALNYKEVIDKIINEVKAQGPGYTVDDFLNKANEYIDEMYSESQAAQEDAEAYYAWLRGGPKPSEALLERLRRNGLLSEDIIDDTEL